MVELLDCSRSDNCEYAATSILTSIRNELVRCECSRKPPHKEV